MRASLAALGSVALLLTAGYAARPAAERWLNPPRDITLEGKLLPDGEQALEAWLVERQREIALRPAFLDAGTGLIETTFASLGISLDVEATAASARRLPTPSGFSSRLGRAVYGPPLETRAVEPVYRFDPERALTLLTELAPSVRRDPVDARLDLEAHLRIEDAPGRELLVEETSKRIEHGERGEPSVFALAFRALPVSVEISALPPVDVSQVLGAYQTSFKGRAGPRRVNIRRAARFLEGLVVPPGKTFSFNRTVGPRTLERGFVEAPVIVNDETEPGLGGGVCQVATTLHAAAVFAGLVVTERRSHSRASGYAPLGLDAAVIDGKVDLRLQNPFDTAVMIHAVLPSSTSIRVEILGRKPLGQVDHAYHVLERSAFYRRLVQKPEISAGKFEEKQKGSYGYDIVSVVRSTREDGSVNTRRYPSKYYPVPEVLWVGAGTDVSALPPLPDGSLGLEPSREAEP